MSHRASLFGSGETDRHLDSPRIRFRRALALSAMTIVLPGLAQLLMGRKWLGRIVLALWLLTVATLVAAVFVSVYRRSQAISFLTDAGNLGAIRIGIVVVAALWLLLFVDAWRLGVRGRLRRHHLALVTVFNTGVTIAAVAAVFFAAQLVNAQREVVKHVFTATKTSAPQQGRYNVLLMGSDSGKGRFSLRPDSMTVLSVDRATGKSALISLPRNLQNVPFPEDSPMRQLYPYGFNCEECLLNAVYTFASGRPDLYPDSDDPGMDATIEAIEGVTGLKINYHILINMSGFDKLVDAVGGVEINVKDRVAIDGVGRPISGWIEPGVQLLDGRETLWFARSRTGTNDFTRMGRQKCVMNAMLQQLSPQKVLFNAEKLSASSKEMLETDIPASELDLFIELALKTRGTKIVTTSFVPPLINTGNPDFAKIRELVAETIAKTETADEAPGQGSAEPGPTESTSTYGLSESAARAQAANATDDLAAVC